MPRGEATRAAETGPGAGALADDGRGVAPTGAGSAATSSSGADLRGDGRPSDASGAAEAAAHPDVPDLLHGGLLYRVVRRFGVEPEDAARAARRGALAGVVLWTPAAITAVAEGTAFPGRVGVPYLLDVAAYVRPLVVVPLLVVAEAVLAKQWRETGARLRDHGLVGPERRDAYDALVDRVTSAVRRVVPEVLCLGLAALLTARLLTAVTSAPSDAWYAATDDAGSTRLTFAGAWSGFVVHSVLFYLSIRWLWLLSLWYRFLLGVARLPVRVHPTHPDRAGGLGFLGRTVAASAPIAFAWSATLASAAANRMIHSGDHVSSFAPVGLVLLGAVLVVFVLPPAAIFLPVLARTRLRALEDWSDRMASSAEGDGGSAPAAATAAPRVRSLQDVEIAVAAVRSMRPVPLALAHVIAPVAAAAAPAVPLLFLAFPAREIFDKVVRLVL